MSDMISKEAVEVFLPEALFSAGCSVDQVDAGLACINSLAVVHDHTPDAPEGDPVAWRWKPKGAPASAWDLLRVVSGLAVVRDQLDIDPFSLNPPRLR